MGAASTDAGQATTPTATATPKERSAKQAAKTASPEAQSAQTAIVGQVAGELNSALNSARPTGTVRQQRLARSTPLPEPRDIAQKPGKTGVSDGQGKAGTATKRAHPAAKSDPGSIKKGAAKDAGGIINLANRRTNHQGPLSVGDRQTAHAGKTTTTHALGRTAARFGLALNLIGQPGNSSASLRGLISPGLLSALAASASGSRAEEVGFSPRTPATDGKAAPLAARIPASAPAPTDGPAPTQSPATAPSDMPGQGDPGASGGLANGTANSPQAHGIGAPPGAPRPTFQPTLPVDQVAVYIARAAQQGSEKFTIRLNPAELGRVEVSLDVAHDGRVTAMLTADKQHTLDLLQRDARVLERALVDSGLQADTGSLNFSLFDQGSGADQAFDETPAAPLLIATDDQDGAPSAIEATAPMRHSTGGTAIDIRI